MKYISKIFCIICAGVLVASCQDDIPGGDETYELSATTPSVTPVNSTSVKVTASASGSHITYRGFCYATSANPTIDDIKITSYQKEMNALLTPLAPGTTYHVRAYAQSKDQVVYSSDVAFSTPADDTSDDETMTEGPEALKRVSVHDPSVVWDPASSNYFIFGSHRASARSTNLMSWTAFTAPWATDESSNAANKDAFTTPQITKFKKGETEYELNFDAHAWSNRGNSAWKIDGNMWAPDVIYNKNLGKWCMYLSVNGDSWYSSIILLTADNIAGPYRYQAPIVMSGFRAQSSYEATDAPIVLGETMPGRYNPSDNYGRHWPNAIDPCVFYDEDGKLWMSYGSWSGGIFMLELDEATGLRDYDVAYAVSSTSDPYFGKKIAGGYYVSGEASYIEYIGGYYYLFVTYGGLDAAGGYQMRVFRSENPNGPYLDSRNVNAIFNSYALNFGASATDNRGVNIFGCYGDWGFQATEAWSERAQGHNSVIAAPDGRAYLVYHTRFQSRGEGHEVRVHQLYQNEEGWLVAAPFEYTGEVTKTARIAAKQYVATNLVVGKYKMMIHRYRLDNTKKEYVKPVDIVLNADGTFTGEQYNGTWTLREGTSFINLVFGTKTYKGVMVEQNLEKPENDNHTQFSNGMTTPCFTALDATTGVTIWGYKVTE
jgi:arabinan endo-1,5-alpha-L-arabinosidase